MKTKLLALFVFALLVFSMGCIGGGDEKKTEPVNIGGNVTVEEEAKEVYSVQLLSLPDDIEPNQTFTIKWKVESTIPKSVKTGLLYGTRSIPYPTSPSNYAHETGSTSKKAPAIITADLSLDKPGTYYVRAYAFVNNRYYWSDERRVTVKEPEKNETEVENPNIVEIGVTVYSDGFTFGVQNVEVSKEVKLSVENKAPFEIMVEVPSVGKVPVEPLEKKTISFTMGASPTYFRVYDNKDNVLGEGRLLPIGG